LYQIQGQTEGSIF